jgi:hypothetical protein
LEDLSVDGRIILKMILNRIKKLWAGFIRLRIGPSSGAVVNTIMKVLTSWSTVSFSRWACSMELAG